MSAWFLMHMMGMVRSGPTPGLEDLPLNTVSQRLRSRYMDSYIDPWPESKYHTMLCATSVSA